MTRRRPRPKRGVRPVSIRPRAITGGCSARPCASWGATTRRRAPSPPLCVSRRARPRSGKAGAIWRPPPAAATTRRRAIGLPRAWRPSPTACAASWRKRWRCVAKARPPAGNWRPSRTGASPTTPKCGTPLAPARRRPVATARRSRRSARRWRSIRRSPRPGTTSAWSCGAPGVTRKPRRPSSGPWNCNRK